MGQKREQGVGLAQATSVTRDQGTMNKERLGPDL